MEAVGADADAGARPSRDSVPYSRGIAVSARVALSLFSQRPPGGPIDFDVALGGIRTPGRILPEDPEYAAAEKVIAEHVWAMTMAGPVPPTLDVPIERAKAMTARRWK